MVQVVWSAQAKRDLIAIGKHVAKDNPFVAEKLAVRIKIAAASLVDFSGRGRPTPAGLREPTSVPPYLIRYRDKGSTVIIVQVRHGARRPLS